LHSPLRQHYFSPIFLVVITMTRRIVQAPRSQNLVAQHIAVCLTLTRSTTIHTYEPFHTLVVAITFQNYQRWPLTRTSSHEWSYPSNISFDSSTDERTSSGDDILTTLNGIIALHGIMPMFSLFAKENSTKMDRKCAKISEQRLKFVCIDNAPNFDLGILKFNVLQPIGHEIILIYKTNQTISQPRSSYRHTLRRLILTSNSCKYKQKVSIYD
jgi:hypothetical protein